MSLLILDDVQKHFGALAVLRGASLRIDPGEKIGLVGRNGGGKTTLLRVIEGVEAPDWGRVTLRKGARASHVEQRPRFEPGTTVRAFVEEGLAETRRLARELEEHAERIGHAQGEELERLMKEHDGLVRRVEGLGGWQIERQIETVLRGIGLDPALWEREARTLSGGEQSRTALARALVEGGDLLLLDEPTNHLDVAGIEWLESWLAEISGAVLVVSHDRRLLSNAVGAIVELEHGRLARYPGRYPAYLELKRERYVAELRAYEEQEGLIRKEEAFVKKHMGSQRTAEARGRQKRLERVVRLPKPHDDVRRPVIRPPKADRGGETVLETTELAGGYGERILFDQVDLRIARGDRIGIVGPNGSGKSTLLKVLAGRMPPLAGEVHRGHRSICGYHDQDTSGLAEDGTPFLEIRRARPELDDQDVRDHLARFLFRGADVDAAIASLSGGERARLCLARLTLGEPSWLALDEPTNHLDLASRTALEEMLGAFPGALVCVSHDREFLDGLATKIFEVEGGRVRVHPGNYASWRAARTAEAEELAAARARETASRSPVQAAPPRPKPKSVARSSGRVRNPYLFEKLEQRIIALEEELAALQAAAATAEVYRDAAKMKSNQVRQAEIERDLELANEEWTNWDVG